MNAISSSALRHWQDPESELCKHSRDMWAACDPDRSEISEMQVVRALSSTEDAIDSTVPEMGIGITGLYLLCVHTRMISFLTSQTTILSAEGVLAE